MHVRLPRVRVDSSAVLSLPLGLSEIGGLFHQFSLNALSTFPLTGAEDGRDVGWTGAGIAA